MTTLTDDSNRLLTIKHSLMLRGLGMDTGKVMGMVMDTSLFQAYTARKQLNR